jgi:hypothetical protein
MKEKTTMTKRIQDMSMDEKFSARIELEWQLENGAPLRPFKQNFPTSKIIFFIASPKRVNLSGGKGR